MNSQRREMFDSAFSSLRKLTNAQMEACFPSLGAHLAQLSDEHSIADEVEGAFANLRALHPPPTADVTPAQAANKIQDLLMQSTPYVQAKLLGKMATGAGYECVGKDAFFQGLGDVEAIRDYAFWSVRCTNGAEYQVSIDPEGASVLDCGVLNFVSRGRLHCFQKM
jgi:hypothetical protein